MAASEAVFSLSFLLCLFLAAGNELARGWGDNIKWVSFEEGKKLSTAENKPMMVLIHKTWCGACKSLKPKFAENQEIANLGEQFIMVNTEDDEEPADSAYSPDGGYIPRIIFVDPQNKVLTEFINEGGNPSYKYYYPSAKDVADSMKRVLEKAKKQAGKSDL